MSGAPTSRRPERFTLLLVLGVVAVLVVLFAAGVRTYRDLAGQVAREAELGEEIRATEERIEALRLEIRRLRHDPETLERLAREELGLVRPDDLVIVYPEEEETTMSEDPQPRNP